MSERQDQNRRERKAKKRAAKKRQPNARQAHSHSRPLVPQAQAEALRARYAHTGATVYPAL